MADTRHNLYVNNNGFVFDYYSGFAYLLNKTGLFIFKGLLEGTPSSEIARALEKEYGISHSVALVDIQEFLQQLSSLTFDFFTKSSSAP